MAWSVPAAAQELPVKTGGFWDVSSITVDDRDLYLVTIFDHVTTPAEDIQREKEANAFFARTARNSAAQSGQRATLRHLGSDMLLQEMTWSH
jgi:hypothetical protein